MNETLTRTPAKYLPRACRRCGGDAFLDRTDEPEYRCLQCGRTVALLPGQPVALTAASRGH